MDEYVPPRYTIELWHRPAKQVADITRLCQDLVKRRTKNEPRLAVLVSHFFYYTCVCVYSACVMLAGWRRIAVTTGTTS